MLQKIGKNILLRGNWSQQHQWDSNNFVIEVCGKTLKKLSRETMPGTLAAGDEENATKRVAWANYMRQ